MAEHLLLQSFLIGAVLVIIVILLLKMPVDGLFQIEVSVGFRGLNVKIKRSEGRKQIGK